MSKAQRDRVDQLFERRPGARAIALALGRAVLVLVVGLTVVAVAAWFVDVPTLAYALPVVAAGAYGYLGYRKGERLEAT